MDNLEKTQPWLEKGKFDKRDEVPPYFRVTGQLVIHDGVEYLAGKQYQSKNYPLGVLNVLMRAQRYDYLDNVDVPAIDFYFESLTKKIKE